MAERGLVRRIPQFVEIIEAGRVEREHLLLRIDCLEERIYALERRLRMLEPLESGAIWQCE
jgi:hypothetical protein